MRSGADRYRGRFAKRTMTWSASEIRALFSVLERPEIISLAGGNTYTHHLVDRVQECVEKVMSANGPAALQYGPGAGLMMLREQLVDLMAWEGIQADPHHVIVTDGAQQGLELLAKVFLDPGDIILTEAPTYVGALSAFSSYQVDARTVPIDAEGLIPEELDAALDRIRHEGRSAKFLYVVPTFQNPAGVTLSPDRRTRVLEICAAHDVLIVEDNPYSQVRFSGEPVTPLRASAPDQVIYLGTLSKTFSPGIRIGWILAPESVGDRLILAKEAANLCSAPFNQMVATEYLSSPSLTDDLATVRKIYRERCQTMLECLDRFFPPEASVVAPDGGLFLWVTTDARVDTSGMLARALEAGVAYLPGSACYPQKSQGARAMRLNFSYAPSEDIEEGMRRLGAVLGDEISMGRSLNF